MIYPSDMTPENIMEFEYEYNRIRDIQENVGFWEINAELQVVAQKQREEVLADRNFS
jgi:hypothetical protein